MAFAPRLFLLGALAMLAFAGNSLLARYALLGDQAGAWTFSLIRLISGAAVLALIVRLDLRSAGSWSGGLSLLIYMAGFSYAYLELGAGLGALILFATVQFTMIGWALRSGERLGLLQWSGLLLAFGALIWLLSPNLDGALGVATLAMIAAGMGWGAYSLIGRGAQQPTRDTAGNFLRASLIALVLSPLVLFASPEPAPSQSALIAALVSGVVTSGLGYSIWYAAWPGFSRAQAGIMQLSVPAIAAIGGVLLLGEALTLQLALSTAIILAGVGVATLSTAPRKTLSSETKSS